jgi:hypothetical protein
VVEQLLARRFQRSEAVDTGIGERVTRPAPVGGVHRIVTLVPRSVADRYPCRGLTYLDVPAAPPAVLAIAWPQQSRTTAVAALVRAATEPKPAQRVL